MDEHYSKDHNAPQNIIKLEFENVDEFESWKHEIQVSTRSYFVKNCGSSENQIYSYYKYNRNGFFSLKSLGQRHVKTQGSNKTNGYCPASINVIVSKLTKKCTIKYNGNHIGHVSELGHLSIDKVTKNDIACKISQHIPFEQILDEIWDNISNII